MVVDATRAGGGVVIQTFATQGAAEAAVRELREAGFTADEISVVVRDEHGARALAADTGAETAKGAGIGAAAGGVLGVIAGLLVGAAVVTIPGIGIVLAGPLATAVGGIVAGGVTGGLAGALAGLGVARDEARHYEQRLEAGDIVVVVAAGPREATAREILHERVYHPR